jgi:anti-sigma regulatory factor (Ser/Thr protein kinase)
MCETTTVPSLAWARAFPATAAQAGEARRFLSAILDGSPATDDVVLCMSELVTNAIIHSHSHKPGGHFAVHVQMCAGILRVEVRDEGGPWTWPVRRRDGRHGRGLLIVDQLARDWGRSGGSVAGWTVWFECDVP